MWQKHYYSVNLGEVVWVLLLCSLTFFSNKIKHTSYFKTRFKNGSNIMFCLLMYISMHIDICSLYKSFALHVFNTMENVPSRLAYSNILH